MDTPPLRDHTNPGVVDVTKQAFSPPPDAPPPPSRAALSSSTGENQYPAARETLRAASTGRGLPADVNVCSQSSVMPSPETVAETRPPARDVSAEDRRPGGLPVEVMVK